LFDPAKNYGVLIDFGFSREFEPVDATDNEDLNAAAEDDLALRSDITGRPPMSRQRFGTQGFRAPEMLLSAPQLTPAIDIWAVGVIFLSVVTQRYPFFVGDGDLTILCQIAAIFGSEKVAEAALDCDRMVQFPHWVSRKATELSDLVLLLNPTMKEKVLNADAFDLMGKMLEISPLKRISAENALAHRFFEQLQ
jgi:cell division control protein 7